MWHQVGRCWNQQKLEQKAEPALWVTDHLPQLPKGFHKLLLRDMVLRLLILEGAALAQHQAACSVPVGLCPSLHSSCWTWVWRQRSPSRTAAVPQAIGAGIWNRNRSSQLWEEDTSLLSHHTRKRYCIAKQLDLTSQGHAAQWFTACAQCRQGRTGWLPASPQTWFFSAQMMQLSYSLVNTSFLFLFFFLIYIWRTPLWCKCYWAAVSWPN